MHFEKSVSEALFQSWLEVVELVSTIQFTDEDDEMVWQFTAEGSYISQSLYKIIKFIEGLNRFMSPLFGV